MSPTFGDELRAAVHEHMACPTCRQPRLTYKQAAAEIGMPLSTFHDFLRGRMLRLDGVDKVMAFVNRPQEPVA